MDGSRGQLERAPEEWSRTPQCIEPLSDCSPLPFSIVHFGNASRSGMDEGLIAGIRLPPRGISPCRPDCSDQKS